MTELGLKSRCQMAVPTLWGGTVSPRLPDNCLKDIHICSQFAVLGVSQITKQSWIVTTASRSFEASWSKSVQKILNEFNILKAPKLMNNGLMGLSESWVRAK